MRWPVAVPAFLLAACVPSALAAAPVTPVRVYLTTDGPGVAQSKDAKRLVQLLTKKLSRKQELTLVRSADEAQLHLDVREAQVFDDNKLGSKVDRGGWRDPSPPSALVIATEKRYGVSATSNRDIVLVVRVVEGDAFVDFDSDPVDSTLDRAAGTVANEIARWIRRRPRSAR